MTTTNPFKNMKEINWDDTPFHAPKTKGKVVFIDECPEDFTPGDADNDWTEPQREYTQADWQEQFDNMPEDMPWDEQDLPF